MKRAVLEHLLENEHGATGLLSSTPEALADDVRRLADDESLRRELGSAAARHAERTFDASAVVQAVESLYLDLKRGFQ